MVYLSTVCVAPKGMQDQKKEKNPCGEVFSEQPFGSNPSTLTFLSSIKHHCRKKKERKRTSERSNQGNSSLKLEKKELFTMYYLV